MRSKFLQQVNGLAAIKCQDGALSAGAVTVKGEAIDRASSSVGFFRSAFFSILAGLSGAAALAWTFKVQESDTTSDGDFSDVTLKTGQTLPSLAVSTSVVDSDGFFMKLDGLKRYVRIVATGAGTTTDTFSIAATATLGDGTPEWLPRGATPPTVYAKA